MFRPIIALTASFLLATASLHARVTRISIATASPVFGGQSFGKVGPYEIVRGTVVGEIDPSDRRNSVITDIQLAPRNSSGKVVYTSTFSILKPVDMTKASGILIYDATNRGNPRFASRFTRFVLAAGAADLDYKDPGDGSIYKAGHLVLTSGWQGDAANDAAGRESINVPIARNPDGSPVTGPVLVRFAADNPGSGPVPIPANTNTLSLPGPGRTPATLDTSKASLVSKASETQTGVSGGVVPIPSSEWAFADCRTAPFPGTPDPGRICLKGGFDTTRLYELVYTAKDPFVLGVGLAAIRDVVSFFRRESKDDAATPNPIAGRTARVIGYGVSQPARMMREFLNLGFNEDEAGRLVWDGAFLDAGAAGGQFNIRFAQPGNIAGLYEPVSEGPAWWEDYEDRVRGRTAWGLLHRCRTTKTCPNIMEIAGGADFFYLRGSLGISGATGKDDIPLPANARRYYMASTNHSGGPGGFRFEQPPVPGCILPTNPLPWFSTERALLSAMIDWVTKGTVPPPSAYPRVTDGTLVPATAAALGWPAIPSAPSPDGVMNSALDYDFGPEFRYNDHSGVIGKVPPPVKQVIPTPAAKLDADGNEIAGVRVLLLQVPLATYASWNPVARGVLKGQECSLQAGSIPFARTKAERLAKDDPRPSIEERYGNLLKYYSLAIEAANKLVAQRLLLPEDADRELSQLLSDLSKERILPLR
jgi:hypothetical protein